jgi:nucleolar protein 12
MKRIIGSKHKSTSSTTNKEKSDSSLSEDEDSTPSEASIESESQDDTISSPIPQHESATNPIADVDLDKAARTVFLGNVSTLAITSKSARKTLERHLTEYPSASSPPPQLESLRFRSTAFAGALPKKAAFATKALHAATTASTHAYAVYSSRAAARTAAARLNGSLVLGRHLRADEVAHPAPVVPRRCIFVGNLDFVDDDAALREDARATGRAGPRPRHRGPADVEEGLWREFGRVGSVESVRVVRDGRTRVGKGFAYVQFTVRLFSRNSP